MQLLFVENQSFLHQGFSHTSKNTYFLTQTKHFLSLPLQIFNHHTMNAMKQVEPTKHFF